MCGATMLDLTTLDVYRPETSVTIISRLSSHIASSCNAAEKHIKDLRPLALFRYRERCRAILMAGKD